MRVTIKKPWVKKVTFSWDHMSSLQRLHYVLDHEDIFLRANLVREGEILAAKVTPESCREYIIEREESPFFSRLDIKKPLASQQFCLLESMLAPSS